MEHASALWKERFGFATAAVVACIGLLSAHDARAAVVAGPVVNPANGHEYYALDYSTWAAAEAEAVALGGHLVTITSASENGWVWTTFAAYGPFWIGFTDEAAEGSFEWTSGEPSAYTSWWVANGEPNNFGGIEHYAEMNNAVWNDNTATGFLRAVVEVTPPGPLHPGDILTGSFEDIVRIDAATGSIDAVATLPTYETVPAYVVDVAVEADGKLLATVLPDGVFGPADLYRVVPATGATTHLRSFASPDGAPSVAVDAAGNILVNRATASGGVLDKLDPSGATLLGSIPYCANAFILGQSSGVAVNGLGEIFASGGRCDRIYKVAFPSSSTPYASLPGAAWLDVAVESSSTLFATAFDPFGGYAVARVAPFTQVPWSALFLAVDPFRPSQRTIVESLPGGVPGDGRRLYALDVDSGVSTELGRVPGSYHGIAVVLPTCADYLDNDRDGAADYPADAGCTSQLDGSEREPGRVCDDGVDNDGDGRVDYAAAGGGDPGCKNAGSPLENPQCNDGLNNDGALGIDFDGGAALDIAPVDGLIDATFNPATPPVTTPDPQCIAGYVNKERQGGCGLGFEVAFVLALLRRRRRWTGRTASRSAFDSSAQR